MSDRNDGGPAFPSHTEHLTIQDPNKPYNGDSTSPDWNPNISYYPDGMSLRDYFAAQALQGFCEKVDPYSEYPDSLQKRIDFIVRYSYYAASVMLKERNK